MNSCWTVNLLTLFPEMFPGPLSYSLAGKALKKKIWALNTVNIRDFATDKHHSVDDTPFGGGAGMVMRADVIDRAICSLPEKGQLIYLSPRGQPLNQALVKTLAQTPLLTILCGRYEGIDERVLDAHDFTEISVGDYVLSGGETAAFSLLDSCIRLLPDVLGNTDTVLEESFENNLLEYPHYTKPAEWTDSQGTTHTVPDILRSGHHEQIKRWRRQRSEKITQERRPDLWKK